MDITPLIPKTRQAITGYGDGGFKLGAAMHTGSLLLCESRLQEWKVASFSAIDFAALADWCAGQELLLIGTGKSPAILPEGVKQLFRARGIAVEVMDTGAACRTYNVLLSEERKVAAALIAV